MLGNLKVPGLARSGRFSPKGIFIDCEECCKNTLMAGRRTTSPGFPADGPERISFYPPEESLVPEYSPAGNLGVYRLRPGLTLVSGKLLRYE
jgi:hypothetical protein